LKGTEIIRKREKRWAYKTRGAQKTENRCTLTGMEKKKLLLKQEVGLRKENSMGAQFQNEKIENRGAVKKNKFSPKSRFQLFFFKKGG